MTHSAKIGPCISQSVLAAAHDLVPRCKAASCCPATLLMLLLAKSATDHLVTQDLISRVFRFNSL